MKVKDVKDLLLWEREHTRLFIVLADRMLQSLPSDFKEDEVLSQTILQTIYKGVFSVDINFRDGVASMARDALKQDALNTPPNKSFKERLKVLNKIANEIHI
jgi:hypothetical protein